jgi:hypothetical protein
MVVHEQHPSGEEPDLSQVTEKFFQKIKKTHYVE